MLLGELGPGHATLVSSLVKVSAGALVMLIPAWLTAAAGYRWIGQPLGSRVGVLAAALVGIVVYLVSQAALRTPELTWLSSGLDQLRQRAGRLHAGVHSA